MKTCLKRHLICGIALILLAGPAPASAEDARSPRKAALLSLLLPGAGEFYAGGGRSARFFLFTEGAFWAGLFAFKALESSRESTFKAFAAAHAGVRTAGKSDAYFDDLVWFRSIYDRNARSIYREADAATLIPETPDNAWEWDSQDAREQFQVLRSRAISARQKALLFTGALVFNRFVSAINAARIARKTRAALPPVEIGVAPAAAGAVHTWLRARF